MPCSDGGNWPPSREESLRKKVPEPMLCALLNALITANLSKQVLETVHWEEAGVTREEFAEWWQNHQAADARRRQHDMAMTLPYGQYAVRDEVRWDGRQWIVKKLHADKQGAVLVDLVSFDDKPVRAVTLKIRRN